MVFLYQIYIWSLLFAQPGAFQRRMLTLRLGLSFLASAASWKPGSLLTFATSLASRIVAVFGPVELFRSFPISIFTWVMMGFFPPNRIFSSSAYFSGCSDL